MSVNIGYYSAPRLSDWIERSTGPGVFASNSFNSFSDISPAISPDSPANHITFATTTRPFSGGGWARISVEDADGTNNGALRFYISPDQRVFGPAQSSKEYFIQWSEQNPAEHIFSTFPGTGSNAPYADGPKHFIGSSYAASNQNNEFVIQDLQNQGCPRSYYQDGLTSAVDTGIQYAGSKFRSQPAIDNGGPEGTAIEQQLRYGPLYPDTPINSGTPSPNNGGFVHVADERVTHEVRVKFGASFSDTLIEAWSAHEGQAPVKWLSRTGLTFGTANGGHDGFWLLTYNTGRTSNGGINTYRFVGDVIRSAQKIKFPFRYDISPI